MADIIPLRGDPHRTAEMLLPWYASGELEAADTAIVQAHLETCEQCRSALDEEARLRDAVKSLPLHSNLGWEKLQGRLAPDLAASPPRPRAAPAWRRMRRPARVLAFIGGQAAVVALAVLLIRPSPYGEADETYHTLGAPAGTAHDRGNAVVIFRPDATEAAMREALAATGGQIVDGPTPAGAYVVRFPDGERDRSLGRLQASQNVLLAQPISMDVPR